MLELHSWLTIRSTYTCADDEYDDEAAVKRIREEIIKNNDDITIEGKNAIYYIRNTISSNHKSADFYELMDTYKKIIEIAPGSYGLIYMWDDEDGLRSWDKKKDEDREDNEFQVYVIKRGTITKVKDTFLSPCIPCIEDEFIAQP